MPEDTPDTLSTLARTSSATSATQEPEPNPLEEMEKEEAEKHTRRRRRGGSGAGMEEDDPLATSIGRLVQRIDSGQELLQNLVVHLGQANKPQTGREVFMAYVNNLLNVCSVEHFKLLRRTIMQMVEQHGICDPSATPAATPTGYAGQPSPSIFPSPNTLLADFALPANWSTLSAEEPTRNLTQLTTPNRDSAANLGGYVRAALGEPLDEPAPGPSGQP